MEISDKKRKEYIDSLYSADEQKQIRESLARYKDLEDPKKLKKILNTAIHDHLLLDEEYRLVKKHLNISKEQAQEIVKKNRIPSRADEKILKLLHGEK